MKIVALERNCVGLDINFDFSQFGEMVIYPNTTTAEEVTKRAAEADIIIANKAPLNRDTLKDASNLKLICETATGFDNIDLAYCKEKGIQVRNVKGYSTTMVAQHTFALALTLAHSMPYYDNFVKSGAYSSQDKFSCFDMSFHELEGQTWGIIGMGNIGKRVASIAKAFGCRVIFYSPTGKSTVTEYEKVDFDTLLAQSDILSIHCPLSDLTRHIVDAKAFKKMKKSAILVNVARGAVIDQWALRDALNNGEIAAAGLDVLEGEPMAKDNPLAEIKDSNKLIITPHIAWCGVETRTRLLEDVRLNIETFLKGEDRNIVNK